MKTIDELNNIIGEIFSISIDSIHPDLCPNDLKNWDSLAQLQLVTAIEKEFNVVLEIDEIFSIYTIGDIYSLLKKRGLIANSDE